MSDSDESIPELTESERIRIQATESDVAAMGEGLRNGTATPEDVEGAFARLMSLDIDPQKRRKAPHIPADDRMRRRSRPPAPHPRRLTTLDHRRRRASTSVLADVAV